MKTLFRRHLLMLILISAVLLQFCKHEPDIIVVPPDPNDTTTNIPCSPDTIYFQNTILPLLKSSCAYSGCHDAATAKDGVILDNYSAVINTGEVKPFQPDESKIYKKITDSDPEDIMPPPPNLALNSEQISTIRKWIEQGAKNNRCSDVSCDSVNVFFSKQIKDIVQNNCQGCHSGASPAAGLVLTNYGEIAAIAGNGKLMNVITHQPGFPAMPQGSKLSSCEISIIRNWVNNGFPNN